jgi:ADP-ribose pyrophosphatase YjhB (NUDIX family)
VDYRPDAPADRPGRHPDGTPAGEPRRQDRSEGALVSTSADSAAQRGLAEKLGIQPGAVVQVVGVDDDVDRDLLDDVAARTGNALITTDDSDDVVDVVLLWWREGDGDLVDALVDSLTNLAESGVVWLLTPKAGRDGHVEPSDIDEAAPTAGLSSTRSTSAAPEWSGTRLVAPKAARSKSRR